MPEEREGTGLLMGVCAGDASIGELGAGAGEAQEAIVGSGLRIKLVNLFVLLEAAVDELARASDDGQTVALGQVARTAANPFLGRLHYGMMHSYVLECISRHSDLLLPPGSATDEAERA